MISPTVGRVVWYYKHVAGKQHKGPMAAHVAFVHNDRAVNLMIINEDGTNRPKTGVPLVQEGEEIPECDYCCWMPYQKGQAAKTEELEKQKAGAK